ncbi:MAG: hypothetical protein IKZ88_09905 [Neisseriaceae bacterium]|nr:hypothetical protein [Neisseriaceae bacterium]
MHEIKFTKADKIKVIAEVASYIDSLDDKKKYSLTFKERKKKRSLNSNSFAWLMLGKLAEVTGIAKEAIYREYIKEIGGNSDLVTVKNEAVEKLCNTWKSMGIGFVYDVVTERKDGFTDVMLYYGSSTYDQAQMSRLINLIVQDCEIFGIETINGNEIERLVSEWGIE